MARRSNRLNVDRLETRDLMAGNLSAVVSNGILFVKEGVGSGNTPNALEIRQLPNHQFRVFGLFTDATQGTTINGAPFKDFTVPTGRLNVQLGGGNDFLKVFDARPQSMLIAAGGAGQADADQVFVSNVRTFDSAFISTGVGNDLVVVSNSTIGDGLGQASEDLSIFTGAGSDTVAVGSNDAFVQVNGGLRVATFSSQTEPGDDRLAIRSATVRKRMALDLGAGKDELTIENSFGDDIVALTGNGDDTVKLTEVRAFDQFFVDTSHGNDTLDMVFLQATDLAVHGGSGFDRLTHFLDGPTHTSSITGWESINGVTTLPDGPIGGPPSR